MQEARGLISSTRHGLVRTSMCSRSTIRGHSPIRILTGSYWRHQVDAVAICGFTSFICCDTTAREASALGYQVYYVDDAISEFSLGDLNAQDLHRMVSSLQGAIFSKWISTAEAVALTS